LLRHPFTFIPSGLPQSCHTGEPRIRPGAAAVAVTKDIWLYQLTDDGLAVELTAKGTKYYKDDDLN